MGGTKFYAVVHWHSRRSARRCAPRPPSMPADTRDSGRSMFCRMCQKLIELPTGRVLDVPFSIGVSQFRKILRSKSRQESLKSDVVGSSLLRQQYVGQDPRVKNE